MKTKTPFCNTPQSILKTLVFWDFSAPLSPLRTQPVPGLPEPIPVVMVFSTEARLA